MNENIKQRLKLDWQKITPSERTQLNLIELLMQTGVEPNIDIGALTEVLNSVDEQHGIDTDIFNTAYDLECSRALKEQQKRFPLKQKNMLYM